MSVSLQWKGGNYVNQENLNLLSGIGLNTEEANETLKDLSLASKHNTVINHIIYIVMILIIGVIYFIFMEPELAGLLTIFIFLIFIPVMIADFYITTINRRVLTYMLEKGLNTKQTAYHFSASAFCFISGSSSINMSSRNIEDSERRLISSGHASHGSSDIEIEKVIFLYKYKASRYDPGFLTFSPGAGPFASLTEKNIVINLDARIKEFNNKIFCAICGWVILTLLGYMALIAGGVFLIVDNFKSEDAVVMVGAILLVIYISMIIYFFIIYKIGVSYNQKFVEEYASTNQQNINDHGYYANCEGLYYLFKIRNRNQDPEQPLNQQSQNAPGFTYNNDFTAQGINSSSSRFLNYDLVRTYCKSLLGF